MITMELQQMRNFCRGSATLFLLLILCLSGGPAYAVDVEFRWAILADFDKGMEPLDFSTTPEVYSGTGLQIYLEHLENCHIYLFLLDSSENLTPLYPPVEGYYNYGFPRGPIFIPEGEQSFAFVPPPGIETFYLIASVDRQFQLERLTEDFLKNPGYPGQQKLLLTQISDMLEGQEKRSRSAEDWEEVERKIKTADGIKKTIFKALEVDISNFYGRSLRIDHK
jgi:hypothetical protein